MILKFGKESLPSVIQNPFMKTKVKRIWVSYSEQFNFRGPEKWSANGSIEFENGETKGEQKFTAETFDEVVLKIKAVLDELK
jgi:hypothetical protein